MEGMVEVFGDLKEGDQVALKGSEELENQSKVNPVGSSLKKQKQMTDVQNNES